MATSIGAGFADAIVTAVDAQTWSPALTVARKYTPEIEVDKLTTAAILTVKFSDDLPISTTQAKHSRGKRFIQVTYDLLLHGKAKRSDLAAVDDLLGLYEEIDAFLFAEANRILTFSTYRATWLESVYQQPGDNDDLRTHGLVEIPGQVTYQYER